MVGENDVIFGGNRGQDDFDQNIGPLVMKVTLKMFRPIKILYCPYLDPLKPRWMPKGVEKRTVTR
jgi:hypothetical protein